MNVIQQPQEQVTVFCRARFQALHRWPDAAATLPAVGYLAQPHRHEFHVELELGVEHDDRAIEFIVLKQALTQFLFGFGSDLGSTSCEMLAREVSRWAREVYAATFIRVEVSEDGENGARLERHYSS